MTTKELIKQLKEMDPDGNLSIALLHRDEYLTDSPMYMQVVDGKEFRENYGEYMDTKAWARKRKILMIVPFND